jgi:hypothetical protein
VRQLPFFHAYLGGGKVETGEKVKTRTDRMAIIVKLKK